MYLFVCLLLYLAFHIYMLKGLCYHERILPFNLLLPEITVVLAVKNEQQRLPHCLDALLMQDYPSEKLDIIVVDDQSTDSTQSILRQYSEAHQGITWINNTQHHYTSSKKGALKQAVAHARGSLILLTDADCIPPTGWCFSMASNFDRHTAFVAGFSPQQSPDNPFLNQFLLVDSVSAAYVSAASISRQKGITATGRNLAFNRHVFTSVGGYDALPDTLSGDDDFVVQRLREFKGIYNHSEHAIVPSFGPQSWKDFFKQKSRHLSSGIHYPLSAKILYACGHGIHFLPLILLFWTPILALLLWFAVAIIDGIAFKYFSNRLKFKIYWKSIFIWQMIYPWLYAASFVRSLKWPLKRSEWKG